MFHEMRDASGSYSMAEVTKLVGNKKRREAEAVLIPNVQDASFSNVYAELLWHFREV